MRLVGIHPCFQRCLIVFLLGLWYGKFWIVQGGCERVAASPYEVWCKPYRVSLSSLVIYASWIVIIVITFSYTLSREYRVARYRYIRLLFTSEDRQFARAMTIDKYDVTIPVFRVRMTSQINCGDVTMLGQKRPPLATMAK